MCRSAMRFAPAIIPLLAANVVAQDLELDRLVATLADEKLDAVAMDRLIELGAPAVPRLVDELERGVGLEVRMRILRVLAAMGCDAAAAAPAVDRLFDFAGDPTYGERILATLVQIAPHWPRAAFRLRVARLELPLPDEFSLAQRDRDASWLSLGMRRVQAAVSADLHPQAPLQAIASLLVSADPAVRSVAADRLGQCGARAASFLPALRDVARRSNPAYSWLQGGETFVNRAARIAIARIAPDDPEAIPGLRDLSRSAERPFERVTAVMALGRQGKRARLAVTDLVQLLHDPDRRVVLEAITALGMIESGYGALEGWMRELTTSADRDVAARARATLKRLERR